MTFVGSTFIYEIYEQLPGIVVLVILYDLRNYFPNKNDTEGQNQYFLVLLSHQTIIPQANADAESIHSLLQFLGSI